MPGSTYCAVVGCMNNSKLQKELAFFRIPKPKHRMKVWAEKIGRLDIMMKRKPPEYRVCSEHFLPEMYVNKRLKGTAFPVLHLPDSFDDTEASTGENKKEVDVVPPESPKKNNKNGSKSRILFEEDDLFTGDPKFNKTLSDYPLKKFKKESRLDLPGPSGCFKLNNPETNTVLSQEEVLIKEESEEDEDDCVLNTKTVIVTDPLYSEEYRDTQELEEKQSILWENDDIMIREVVQNEPDFSRTGIITDSISNIRVFSTNIELPNSLANVLSVNKFNPDINIPKFLEDNEGEIEQSIENNEKTYEEGRVLVLQKRKKVPSIFNKASQVYAKKRLLNLDNLKSEKKTAKLEQSKGKSKDIWSYNNYFERISKWHAKLRATYHGDIYDKELKLFAYNLYFISPPVYQFVQKAFALPFIKGPESLTICLKTKVCDDTVKLLTSKLKKSHPNYRYCVIVLKKIKLRKNLQFNVRNDEIIGLEDINDIKQTTLAENAVVLVLKGCLEDYKQPLGYALLGTGKQWTELRRWLNKSISKLSFHGFVVCAVIAPQSSDFDDFSKSAGISPHHPYIEINRRKIHFFFDVPDLYTKIHYYFSKYDFVYQGKVASWKHVVAFYENDVQRKVRLAPKLTYNHLQPQEYVKPCDSEPVFSYSVAAGISADIESKNLPASAQGTMDFILDLAQLADILNSSKISDPHKCSVVEEEFSGEEYQLNLLSAAFDKILDIKPKNEAEVTSAFSNVFIGLCISISAMLGLKKYYECIMPVYLSRFSQNDVDDTFEEMEKCTLLTPALFRKEFTKLVFDCYLKLSSPIGYKIDLDSMLPKKLELNKSKRLFEEYLFPQIQPAVCVNSWAYKNISAQKPFVPVCNYLFERCCLQHNCKTFDIFQQEIKGQTGCPADFVNYVELCEDIFLKKIPQFIVNKGLSRVLMRVINRELHVFHKPCPCFPQEYFLKTFVRLRIHMMIKMNNSNEKSCVSNAEKSCVSFDHL